MTSVSKRMRPSLLSDCKRTVYTNLAKIITSFHYAMSLFQRWKPCKFSLISLVLLDGLDAVIMTNNS
ncbi:unnamed protein product, partial [Fasciola hepatica]